GSVGVETRQAEVRERGAVERAARNNNSSVRLNRHRPRLVSLAKEIDRRFAADPKRCVETSIAVVQRDREIPRSRVACGETSREDRPVGQQNYRADLIRVVKEIGGNFAACSEA